MIDVVLELVNGLLGWLNAILPSSPFTGLIESNENVVTALGWLNWLVPISDLLAIFAVYLGALLAWQVVDTVFDGINFAKSIVAGK